MSDNKQQNLSSQELPFFARYLEGQFCDDLSEEEMQEVQGGFRPVNPKPPLTYKHPSDIVSLTKKYPSDQEEHAVTEKYPSDGDDHVYVTQKYPSDGDDDVLFAAK
jgi:Serine endopeptidase inhibitors